MIHQELIVEARHADQTGVHPNARVLSDGRRDPSLLVLEECPYCQQSYRAHPGWSDHRDECDLNPLNRPHINGTANANGVDLDADRLVTDGGTAKETLDLYCHECDRLSTTHRYDGDDWICTECGNSKTCSNPNWSDNCDGDLVTEHQLRKGLCAGCIAVIKSWSEDDDAEDELPGEQQTLVTDGGQPIRPGQTWTCHEANAEYAPPAHDTVALWPDYPRFDAVVDDVLDGVAQLTVADGNSHPRTPAFGATLDIHADKLRDRERWSLTSEGAASEDPPLVTDGGQSTDGTEQWDDDYAQRNEWCEGCDELFNADWLKDGLCQRCRYVNAATDQEGSQ